MTRGIRQQARRHERAALFRAARLLRAGARPVASVHDAFRADLRRSHRPYWARHSRWTAAFALYAVSAVVAGALLHWLVTVAMLAPFGVEAARLRWRARPGWGRAACLPPGSVGVGVEPIVRFDALARATRRYGPVFKSNYYGTPMVGIADLSVGAEFLRTNAADLGFRPNWFDQNIPGGAVRWAAEPRHTELRRMFARAMSPRVVGEWVPVLDGIVRAVLAQQAAVEAGAAPLEFLHELSTQVCTAFLFGVLPTDAEYAEIARDLARVDITRPYPLPREQEREHLDAIAAAIRGRLARAEPGRPLSVADVLAAEPSSPLDDLGVMRNLVYLGLGPRNDLAGLMIWICWYLAHHPRWLDAVRQAPAGDDLPDCIVSETLRLDQSEYLFRVAQRDLDVGGFRVPTDWVVRVCIREIHRDPESFPDPTRFDPDRFRCGGPGPSVYAPLGVDHHSCIGEPLLRTVGAGFVHALADGYDVDILDDGRRILSTNGHWAPSERFRVRLVPIAGA